MADYEVMALAEEKGEQFNDKAFREKGDVLTRYRSLISESLSRQLPEFDEEALRASDRIRLVPRGSLKSDSFVEAIRKFQPDMTMIFGSGIVSQSLLDEGGSCVLGSHQGLPQYFRGSGSNFFAFLEGKASLMGISLHEVDKGIDTGPVIAQCAAVPGDQESFFDYSARLTFQTIELMVAKAKEFASAGKLPTYALPEQGQLFQRKDFNPESVSKAFTMLEVKPFSIWYRESLAREKPLLLGS